MTTDASGNVIENADYIYDVFDRRIAKSVDSDGAAEAVIERFVYDGKHITLVFDGQGNQTERFLHCVGIDELRVNDRSLLLMFCQIDSPILSLKYWFADLQ